MYILQILFSYGLLQNTGYSSLGYTVGPCWLSSLYIVVCMCQSQPPNLFLPIWRSLHTFLVLFLDMSIFKVLQMVSFKFILCLLLGHSCFCTLTLYPVTLLKYFINSNIYQSSHLDFLHIESLAENNYLDFFFPFCPTLITFISFSCLLYWPKPPAKCWIEMMVVSFLIYNLK